MRCGKRAPLRLLIRVAEKVVGRDSVKLAQANKTFNAEQVLSVLDVGDHFLAKSQSVGQIYLPIAMFNTESANPPGQSPGKSNVQIPTLPTGRHQ